MNKKDIDVFISYATNDSDKFRIPFIAEQLGKNANIDNVLYWEKDMEDDIIKYMNDNIGNCDIFLLFCSQNSLESDVVEMEWQAALKLKKKIIPVFNEEKDIPPLLSSKLGIKFNENDINGVVEKINELILKKLKIHLKIKIKNENIKSSDIALNEMEKVLFRGAKIPLKEASCLEEIENSLLNQFKLVKGEFYDKEEGFSFNKQMRFRVSGENVIGIDFYHCGLEKLPESIKHFKFLISLNLESNHLETLPETIGDLISLKYLNLEGNRLMVLPKSVGQLNSLRHLNLNYNELEILPSEMENLKSLEIINLDGNKIADLPKCITKWKNLQGLNLGGNQLSFLPNSLKDLKFLKTIDLGSNKFTNFPEALVHIKSLVEIYLRNNQIRTLPKSILKLEHLKLLDLEENPLLIYPDLKTTTILTHLKKSCVDINEWNNNLL